MGEVETPPVELAPTQIMIKRYVKRHTATISITMLRQICEILCISDNITMGEPSDNAGPVQVIPMKSGRVCVLLTREVP